MSRYVDLDEVVEAMYYDEEHEEWNLKKETIESALNHVDKYTIREWIPVSERLPKEDGRYLCDWQGMRVGTCYFHKGHFRVYGDIKDKYVTAWMPLPKPYEEDNE